MPVDTLLFYLFAFLTLAGAVATVTLRSAVHCAIALIGALGGVAGLYLLQRAEFLFAVQIVLYIGGIMVLFLFVIMLVNLDAAAKEKQYHRHVIAALASVAGTGALLLGFLYKGGEALRLPAPNPATGGPGNVEELADALFSEYLVPFEAVSLLLLVAIVGAVVMAKKRLNADAESAAALEGESK